MTSSSGGARPGNLLQRSCRPVKLPAHECLQLESLPNGASFPDVVAFFLASWLQAWSNGVSIPGLHLPEVNPFVPDDLSLLPVEGPREGLPVVLLEDAGVRLWQRTDLRFENPKATIVLDFQVGFKGAGKVYCVGCDTIH